MNEKGRARRSAGIQKNNGASFFSAQICSNSFSMLSSGWTFLVSLPFFWADSLCFSQTFNFFTNISHFLRLCFLFLFFFFFSFNFAFLPFSLELKRRFDAWCLISFDVKFSLNRTFYHMSTTHTISLDFSFSPKLSSKKPSEDKVEFNIVTMIVCACNEF